MFIGTTETHDNLTAVLTISDRPETSSAEAKNIRDSATTHE